MNPAALTLTCAFLAAVPGALGAQTEAPPPRPAPSLPALSLPTGDDPAPRPPERPADDAEQPDTEPDAENADRPPRPPAGDAAGDAGETPDPASDEPDEPTQPAEPDESDAPDREAAGPPLPPIWWQLREDDRQDAACRRALDRLGTVYEQQPQITEEDDRDCGIARPVFVTEAIAGVALEGGAAMRCDTAHALAIWTRDFLRPAAAALPDAPRLTGMQLGTTYDCRPRVGTEGAQPPLSEHAFGNAIDIMGFSFDRAEPLTVQPRSGDGDLAEAFQRSARSSACLVFTTVLGPGSNAAHDDHLHLDIAERNHGWRLCD